jgi:predicted TIM-barrel fold metal-dependent hydrolase
MDADRIDKSVLYPTHMLAIHDYPDKAFAVEMCRIYNDWISAHCSGSDGRLYAVAVLPQWDMDACVAELRRAATLPNVVGAFMRPNPMIDWKPFFDPVYDPLWTAACDTNFAIGFHPLLTGGIPGACSGLHLNRLAVDTPWTRGEIDFRPALPGMEMGYNNHFFAQGISNPVDMMTAIAFMTGGGVFERFPELRAVFLESNGGWIVTWLERLDHHAKEFGFDVPWLEKKPSEHFRTNCWISFDPDESILAFTARSPLVGADRIVWASDYPHPDAKFPGTVDELDEATESLTDTERAKIAGTNTSALYGIDV